MRDCILQAIVSVVVVGVAHSTQCPDFRRVLVAASLVSCITHLTLRKPKPKSEMDARSERLTATLTACSTTPRTTRRVVDEAVRRFEEELHVKMYEEAKLALHNGEHEVAKSLFLQCPDGYRHTATYKAQCDTYRSLCAAGAVVPEDTADLRRALAEVVDSPDPRYADALRRHGYTAQALRELDMTQVDAVATAAAMSDGHRAMLARRAEDNTPWLVRFWVHASALIGRCGILEGIAKKCLV